MYNSDTPSRAELPSSKQLLRSTLIAMVVALVLLVAVVLPAEYGIDPTGIGGVLKLTAMGEIKQQLAEEAAADELDRTSVPLAVVTDSESKETTRPASEPDSTLTDATAPMNADGWRDEFSLSLTPAQGKEIKLVLTEGQSVTYEWSVNQGHLNSDLHTDNGPNGKSHSYRQGRAETLVEGDFTAVSDGAHGWFWRNRSEGEVTVTLRVRGDYTEVKGAVQD